MASAGLMGELSAVAALLLFSVNIILTKAAAARLNLNLGFLISVAVNVLFAALLFAVQFSWREQPLIWQSHGFWFFVLAGVFSTWLGRWFFFESVVQFGPSRASVFQITSPLFTAVFAWAFLGEALRPLELAGMGLAMGGLLLVMPGAGGAARTAQPSASAGKGQGRWLKSALVLGLGSSIAYSLGNIFRGSAIRNWDEAILGALIGASAGLVLHVATSRDKK